MVDRKVIIGGVVVVVSIIVIIIVVACARSRNLHCDPEYMQKAALKLAEAITSKDRAAYDESCAGIMARLENCLELVAEPYKSELRAQMTLSCRSNLAATYFA
ncbi:uncharacterized protein LOC126377244 isoform X2 [Pectinophora gossypiella]|uniref:uncharacterized protein LOC126377244 isoform X2 n=1 Tax=Pectinophora gossypiella TaxID=13191 RepID=UPI00214F0350|nr:uncharacterized protein LOC126377244 isoform X2 [Pectinophora gossypiella]